MAATADQTTAMDIVQSFLDDLGLGSMSSWAWDQVLSGKSWNEIYPQLRKRDEYKAIYPAMDALSKAGKSMTEGEYRAYTKDVQNTLTQWGIPVEMYGTPDGVAKMLLNNVNKETYTSRIQMAAVGAMTAPQEVKDAYKDLYGLSGGDLIATYLDLDKALPVLERKAAAAQVAGAAYREHMSTTVAEAERLASLGITFDQAVRGYGQASVQQGLDSAAGLSTNREDRVAGAFGDAAAAERVTRAQQARQAQFQGSGGLAAGQEGVTGLGRGSP